MKAKDGVLDRLNDLLSAELTAINQFFLHAEMCRNWGYERLCEKIRARSVDEMKDAEEFVQHILYLEGKPSMTQGKLTVGESVTDQFQADLKLETDMLNRLRESITHCTKVGDYTTRSILERMIKDEERHIDWIETQIHTIKQVGLQNYLTEQIRKE